MFQLGGAVDAGTPLKFEAKTGTSGRVEKKGRHREIW
jgi:hypothetical protein